MDKSNSQLSSLLIAGLLGGLIGAGLVSLAAGDGESDTESIAVSARSNGSRDFEQIHRDLERLIELQERASVIPALPPSARSELAPKGDIPPGLIPALASLEKTVRELLSRPSPSMGGREENNFFANVGTQPPNRNAQLSFVEENKADHDSIMDRYFGATMAQIYSQLGRPDQAGASTGGAIWYYENIGEGQVFLTIQFLDGILYQISR